MFGITRPTNGRVLGGVCAGIADRYDWQRRTVRNAFLISCLLPGPQFVAYLAAWMVLPEGRNPAQPIDIDEVRRPVAA